MVSFFASYHFLVGVKVMVVSDSLVFACDCLNLQGQGETFGPG